MVVIILRCRDVLPWLLLVWPLTLEMCLCGLIVSIGVALSGKYLLKGLPALHCIRQYHVSQFYCHWPKRAELPMVIWGPALGPMLVVSSVNSALRSVGDKEYTYSHFTPGSRPHRWTQTGTWWAGWPVVHRTGSFIAGGNPPDSSSVRYPWQFQEALHAGWIKRALI